MDDFSLARPAGHLIMGDGSGPDGLAKKDGAKALSGAASVDTATTQVDKPSRTKNLIIEYPGKKFGYTVVRHRPLTHSTSTRSHPLCGLNPTGRCNSDMKS
jgi:hypothetical protein